METSSYRRLLERIFLRQIALDSANKPDYSRKRHSVFSLTTLLEQATRETHPLAAEVCVQLSHELIQKIPTVQNIAIVPMGSLSTDAWRVKEVMGLMEKTDLDWAMLIDLPSEVEFPKDWSILDTFELFSGLTDELLSYCQERIAVISNGKLKSCDIYVPGILGSGFNLRNSSDARLVINTILINPTSTYSSLVSMWFNESFPPEINKQNRRLFLLSLSELNNVKHPFF